MPLPVCVCGSEKCQDHDTRFLHYERHHRASRGRQAVAILLALGWNDLAREAIDRVAQLDGASPEPDMRCADCGQGPFTLVATLAAHTEAEHGREPTRDERTPRRAA